MASTRHLRRGHPRARRATSTGRFTVAGQRTSRRVSSGGRATLAAAAKAKAEPKATS
jgi:hypothetical protein